MLWLFLKIWPAVVWAGLLINEVSFKGLPEWVEVYNDSEETVDLSGLILKDANNSSRDDLTLEGVLVPKSYMVFESQKSWLNDTGDTLYLVSSESGTILDQMTFEKAVEGKTWGKSGGDFMFMEPSRGGANVGTVSTPTATQTVTPTVTATKAITQSPTPTVVMTKVSTPSLSKTTTPSPTLKPTEEKTPTPEAVLSEEKKASPSSSTDSTLVLGASVSGGKKKEQIIESKDETLVGYGYMLMAIGSVMSMAGVGIGYLKYRQGGDKMRG